MKLIFVAKCSYRCQETTISNPPESLGGGPPFCARKDLAPRANFRKSQNLIFCFPGQVRHQNKGFLTRGIDCRWSQILKTFHFRSRLDFYIFRQVFCVKIALSCSAKLQTVIMQYSF